MILENHLEIFEKGRTDMLTYPIEVAGLRRELPICKVTEELYIGAFIVFGDAELTVACASALLERIPADSYDYMLTAEAKSIPLIHEMARQSGAKKYFIARKGSKVYMPDPIHVSVRSITTLRTQDLFLGSDDCALIKGKRILLVDDNDINLEIEAQMLTDAGFLVETAGDGRAAYETVRQSRAGEYDLILMDIQMPVMDGYDAARAIRGIQDSELSGIPIIAVSANAFEEDRRKALESGMNAHLPKPLDMAQLFEVMGKFLRI